jgi:hypothetical protein
MLASSKAAEMSGRVLIILDCEDGCPGILGPDLLHRAKTIRSDVTFLVVLASREYETWFITAASSLRGRRGLSQDLDPPSDAEGIRDAKGWLGARMNVSYDPVVHQLEFTRTFDLEQARANRSFDRFYLRIREFLEADGD